MSKSSELSAASRSRSSITPSMPRRQTSQPLEDKSQSKTRGPFNKHSHPVIKRRIGSAEDKDKHYLGFESTRNSQRFAKYVQEKDKVYSFQINDKEVALNKRPGNFDAKFPPEPNVRIIASSESYCFELELEVAVQIRTLKDIDLSSNSFFLKMEVQVVWLVKLEDSTEYEEFYDHIIPSIIIVNAAEDLGRNIFEGHTKKTGTVRPRKENKRSQYLPNHEIMSKHLLTRYSLKTTMNATIHHDFDPSGFPFDSQALPIVLRSQPVHCWGRTVAFGFSHASQIGHLPNEMTKIANDADQSGDFDVKGLLCMRIGSHNESDSLTMSMDHYVVTVIIQRAWKSFLLKILVPVFMIHILSPIAFWIPPCSLDSRLSVSLTLFLTEASLIGSGLSGVPHTAHILPVHWLILGSLFTLLCQSFLFLAVRSLCIPNPDNEFWGISLDPEEDEYDTMRYRFYLDEFGIFLTIGSLVLSLSSQLVAWQRYYFIRKQASSTASTTPDLLSLEYYFKYIENTFLIKQGGESSPEFRDAPHVDTAYKAYHKHFQDEEIEGGALNRAVLIFDCGTGATKAIIATSDKDGVRVLEPQSARDDPKFRFELTDVKSLEESGPSLREFYEKCEEKIINEQAIAKDKGAIKLPDCPLKVVIGVSHWYRATMGKPEHKKTKEFFDELIKDHPSWLLERITALDECWYEMKSVQYAWGKYRSDNTELCKKSIDNRGEEEVLEQPEKIQAILGVGTGSTQFSTISEEKLEIYRKGCKNGFLIELAERDKLKGSEDMFERRFVEKTPYRFPFQDKLCFAAPTPVDSNWELDFQIWKSLHDEIQREKAFIPRLLAMGSGMGKEMILNEGEKTNPDFKKCADEVKGKYTKVIEDWTEKNQKHHVMLEGIPPFGKSCNSCFESCPRHHSSDGLPIDEAEYEGKGSNSKFSKLKRLDNFTVMAISGNFYSAKEAELVEKLDSPPSATMLVKDVIQKFEEKYNSLLKKLHEMEQKELKNAAKNISSLMFLSIL